MRRISLGRTECADMHRAWAADAQGAVVRSISYRIVTCALLSVAACTYRHRLAAPYPATLPVDQRVEVWQGRAPIVLNHVTFDSVGVSGQQLPWRPACGSCRVTIPMAEADSIQLVNHDVAWAIGGTVGLITVWMLYHCWPSRACFD
jgi:hypothetical protein